MKKIENNGSLSAPHLSDSSVHLNADQAVISISKFFDVNVSTSDLSRLEEVSAKFLLEKQFDEIGLVATFLKPNIKKIQSGDCPLIVQSDKNKWYVITEIQHGGLAVCSTETNEFKLVNLASILDENSSLVWSVRPYTGPEKYSKVSDKKAEVGFFRAFLPTKSILLSVVIATITINILALAIPLATMNIFDRVIANAAFDTLWAIAIGAFIAVAFDFCLRNLRNLLLDRASGVSDTLFSNSIFDKILGAKMSARQMSIGMQSNTLREFESIREYFNSLTVATLGDLPFLGIFLLAIWLVAGNLVFIPLLAIPVIFVLVLLIQLRLKKLIDGSFQDSVHKNSLAIETISNVETLKISRAEKWAGYNWEKAVASQLQHSLAIRFWSSLSLNIVSFIQSLTTIALLIAGVYSVTSGDISPGALFAANMLAMRCLGPVATTAALLSRMQQMKMVFASVKQIYTMEQELTPEKNSLELLSIKRDVVFNKVNFTYSQDSNPVLENVSFRIRRGERVGIIGGIGSGKSTVLKLLACLHTPTSGEMLLDGIPSTHVKVDDVRNQFGYLLQDASFFSGSLRDNILLGRKNITDATLLNSLSFAGVLPWLKKLPMGLDTPIGENGNGLSGGQRQTISIARALCSDSDFLVLDEPTSDLDTKTEKEIVKNLKGFTREKTLILVTHRPALIEALDRLIVIENGKVIIDGAKQQVLDKLQNTVAQRNNITVTPSVVKKTISKTVTAETQLKGVSNDK